MPLPLCPFPFRRLLLVVALSGILLWTCPPAQATLTNRWSFNNASGGAPAGTTLIDSVSNAPAVVRGNGATFTGAALQLPGTTNGAQPPSSISAYLDLPNGLISSKTNLTVEVWYTALSDKLWQRVFDFGRTASAGDGTGAPGEYTGTTGAAGAPPAGDSAYDNILLAFETATSTSTQRIAARVNGGGELGLNSSLTTALNTRYHYAMTFTDGAGSFGTGGGQLAWYRNGALVGTVDVNFHLRDLHDVNNWLGRSQFSNDSTSNAAYDEFRVYDTALSASAIAGSYNAGPDASFAAPVAQPDIATTHYGQRVRINVLANDTGIINPATVTIVTAPQYGSALSDSEGFILYTPPATGQPASDSFTYQVSGAGGPSAATSVTVNFTGAMRVNNTPPNVPLNPPATAVQVVPAFGTLSFSQPLDLVSPPGDTKRLFVLEKTGLMRVITDVTATSPAAGTFLDLNALLTSRGESLSTQSEQGLLGLAFHPGYAQNRYFFLFYSVNMPATTDPGTGAARPAGVYERISRFTTQAANPNAADPTSELVLIEQFDNAGNHNGGGMAFGPDGYLYVGIGDEGGGGDTYANSQKIDKNFFSCFLRIDVDKKPGNLEPNPNPNPNAVYAGGGTVAPDAVKRDNGLARYWVPADNPFVGATTFNGLPVAYNVGGKSYVRTEFYAVGMRNPWRWSFDPPTGDLWCGDVGQDKYEEIDLITKGGNYGWNFFEARHPYAGTPPAGFVGISPIYEYVHPGVPEVNTPGGSDYQGNVVTGGFVYRGSRFASLQGAYVFCDEGSGNIWTLRRNTGNTPPTVTRIAGTSGIVSFAPDPSNGDVLMANINAGTIQRLIVGTADSTYPATLSSTNLFASLTDLSPNPSLVPYAPNVAFWSDYAIKSRWFMMPDAVSKMTWNREGAWTFPTGQIWVKHFDMDTTRGDDSTKKRIETRVLVKNSTGVYGVSYRWNDAGTEANLVDDAGADFPIAINNGGTPYTQQYHIPSRAECITCHNGKAGGALSFNTRQLNRTGIIPNFSGNQISLLSSGGYLSNTPDSPNTLPRHIAASETTYPIEARVRSYIAVNCSYCHQPGGTAPTNWNGLPQVTLEQTGLINGPAINNNGNSANQLVVPGDTVHSVVYDRVSASNGFSRMPPLDSNELDQTSISMLASWINASLPSRQTYAQWRLAHFGSATSPDGDPNADPDHDGHTNEEEFLAGTDPLSAASAFAPQFSTVGSSAVLSLNVPANRSFQIEASPDLISWSLWDVPGNNGIPQPGGTVTLSAPLTGPSEFFRIRFSEN